MAKQTIAERVGEHTAGPWRVVPSAHQQEFTHWIERPAADGLERLTVAAVLNVNDSEANARLIAASPRMFDALKGLVGLIQLLPDEEQRRSLKRNHRYIEACEALATASESEHA